MGTVSAGTVLPGTVWISFGHRVEPGWTERPTTHQATNRQPGSADGPVHLEGLVGVGGARGVETTG